jgi:hypothetical protein
MRKVLFAAILLAFSAPLIAQTINDESVIRMVQAGLSDDVIVATINSNPGKFDTSPDGLIALKQAGASNKVIAAIVAKGSSSQPAPGVMAAPPAPAPPPIPLPEGTQDLGVFYKLGDGGWLPVNWEVVIFESGGIVKHVATAGLIKQDLNGVIGGARSRLVVRTPARFILHVPDGVSPLDYRLVRLRVNGNNREFRSVTGGLAHESEGSVRDDVDFSTRDLGSSAYEVLVGSDLADGEYGFVAPVDAAAQRSSSGKIYTFAIVR